MYLLLPLFCNDNIIQKFTSNIYLSFFPSRIVFFGRFGVSVHRNNSHSKDGEILFVLMLGRKKKKKADAKSYS